MKHYRVVFDAKKVFAIVTVVTIGTERKEEL